MNYDLTRKSMSVAELFKEVHERFPDAQEFTIEASGRVTVVFEYERTLSGEYR